MRLRFTIRDLLWLMVVVALATGWWLDKQLVAHGRHAALMAARARSVAQDEALARQANKNLATP
jgi:hypothetical protein